MEDNRKALENERTLSSRGVKLMAKVVKFKRIMRNNGNPSLDENGIERYEIDYQFEVEGNTYIGKTFIGRKLPLEPIEVVYDPQSPENNLCAAQEPTRRKSITDLLLILVIFSIFIFSFFSMANKYLR